MGFTPIYGLLVFISLFSLIVNIFHNDKIPKIKNSIISEFGTIDIFDRTFNVELSNIGKLNYPRINPKVTRITNMTINDVWSIDYLYFIQGGNNQINKDEILSLHPTNIISFKERDKNLKVINKEIDNKLFGDNTFSSISLIYDHTILFLNPSNTNEYNVFLLNYKNLDCKFKKLDYLNNVNNTVLEKINKIYFFNGIDKRINKLNIKDLKIESKKIQSDIVNGSLMLVKDDSKLKNEILYLLGGKNINNGKLSDQINLFDFQKNQLKSIGKLPSCCEYPIIKTINGNSKKYIILLQNNFNNNLYFFDLYKKQFKEINIPNLLKKLKIIDIEFPLIIFDEGTHKYITIIKGNKIKIVARISTNINNNSLVFLNRTDKNNFSRSFNQANYILIGGKYKNNEYANDILKLNIRRK